MFKRITAARSQQGLSLIEVLVAMTVGLLLLSGIVSVFIANKRIYKEQDAMARLQENARFALDMVMHDIRMAGYSGCADDLSSVQNHINGISPSSSLSFESSVEGSENGGNWQPSGSTDLTGTMLPGTDALTVRYLDETNLKVGTPYMVTPSSALHVVSNNGLAQFEIVGVSDCESADIFQISNANPDGTGTVDHNTGVGTPGNAGQNLQKIYLDDASIVRFVSRRYFIGQGDYGGPSLFRDHFARDREDSDGDGNTTEVIQHSQELIEGVENMQVLYGVDTDADRIADTYLDADSVGGAPDWTNVVSVRLAMLFRTIDENFLMEPDNETHTLLGGTAAGGIDVGPAGDHHRRRVFTVTVQIRNRT